MTALYSVLHLLVDGVCALAMFGAFCPSHRGYFYILIYNFCAFALQMPIGAAVDYMNTKNRERQPYIAFCIVAAGVLCTIAGAVTHPAILGIGNALFHVGGGVGTVYEDNAQNRHGAGLGVFVAPGALGLYLGTRIANAGMWEAWFPGVSILAVILCVGMACLQWHGGVRKAEASACWEGGGRGMQRFRSGRNPVEGGQTENSRREFCGGKFRLAACCMMVVVLRSYIGMAVSFPWKTGVVAGTLSVLALVCGKMAGGFLAARHGAFNTTVISLSFAAFCYLGASAMPLGLAALFLFNMTMPVTLYWMICAFPEMPGFAFGFLTFALFLGFLPGYFSLLPGADGNAAGCIGSLLSLALLTAGCGRRRRWKDI